MNNVNIGQDAIVMVPRVGDIAKDADGVQWIVTAGQSNNKSFNVSREDFGWSDVITRDETDGSWYMMMPSVRGGSDVVTFTGRNISDILGDNAKPTLPKRVPGQSLTDAYAAQHLTEQEELRRKATAYDQGLAVLAQVEQETALKAQRLNEIHDWLTGRYADAVEALQMYKQRVYAEILYFIETGRRPLEYPTAMAEFEKNLFNTVSQAGKVAGS